MFYKIFKNHRKKLLDLLKLKSISESEYCKLQTKNVLYAYWSEKKKIKKKK